MIISSQRYLNNNIINEKAGQIEDVDSVTLPIVYAGELDGESIYILIDGHHTGEAARALGITINYETVDADRMGYDSRWTLDEWLDNLWIDSDWHDYETGRLVF